MTFTPKRERETEKVRGRERGSERRLKGKR
jgi:hypothetical protein